MRYGGEVVTVIEKFHCCEYDVERRLEIYKDEEESEEITYVGKETYQSDLGFLMQDNKDKDEEKYGIFDESDTEKSHLDAETNMNKRNKIKKVLKVNRHINSSNKRYMHYNSVFRLPGKIMSFMGIFLTSK